MRNHLCLEPEFERRTHTFLRIDLNVAPRLLANEFARVEAQTRALTVTHLIEAVEYLFLVLTGDPYSIVLDYDLDRSLLDLLVNNATFNRNSLIIMAVLDCILQEIEEYLCKSAPIVFEKLGLHFLFVVGLNLNIFVFGL